MAIPRVIGATLTLAAVVVALIALLAPDLVFIGLDIKPSTVKPGSKCPLGYSEADLDIQLPADHPAIIGRNTRVKTIFYNASIWTANDDQPNAEALAVNSNGYIVAVGLSGKVMDYFQPNFTEVIDLYGGYVVPGLIDPHVHLMAAGLKIESLNLNDIESKHEFMRTIEVVARHPNGPGSWFFGDGWNEQKIGELPDKMWLDAYIRRSPAFMVRYDHHLVLVNSVALKLANITKSTKDPPGGKIDRDENGEPTGILRENAMFLVSKLIPKPSQELKMRYFMNSQRVALENGITCVHDMAVGFDSTSYADLEQFYIPMADENKLKIRIGIAVNLEHLNELKSLVESRPQASKLRHESLKLFWGGLKVFSDGSLGSKTALMRQPYHGSDNSGEQLVEWLELQKQIEQANQLGFQVMVHAIGDKAVEEVTEVMAKVAAQNISGVMNRIEHAQHISGANVAKKMSSSRIGVTVNPQHMMGDLQAVQNMKNQELLANTHAYATLYSNEVDLALASDWPIVELNPWQMLHDAVYRKQYTLGSNGSGDVGLDPQVALKGVTYYASKLMGVEDVVGRIKVGLKADFVVLDKSPILAQQHQDLPNTLMTYVDGECVHGCQ